MADPRNPATALSSRSASGDTRRRGAGRWGGALLAILVCGLVGCRSVGNRAAGQPHTLASDQRLPREVIRRLFGIQEWKWWQNKTYDGLVILRGQVEDDGHLSDLRVVTAYPNDSRNGMARELGQQIRISAVRIGTRTRPSGEIYALFYEHGGRPHHALVFGAQLDPVAPATRSVSTHQVLIHPY